MAHTTSDEKVATRAKVGSNLGRDNKNADCLLVEKWERQMYSYWEFSRFDLRNEYGDDAAIRQECCVLTSGPPTRKLKTNLPISRNPVPNKKLLWRIIAKFRWFDPEILNRGSEPATTKQRGTPSLCAIPYQRHQIKVLVLSKQQFNLLFIWREGWGGFTGCFSN